MTRCYKNGSMDSSEPSNNFRSLDPCLCRLTLQTWGLLARGMSLRFARLGADRRSAPNLAGSLPRAAATALRRIGALSADPVRYNLLPSINICRLAAIGLAFVVFSSFLLLKIVSNQDCQDAPNTLVLVGLCWQRLAVHSRRCT